MAIDFKSGDSIEVLETADTLKKRIAGCVGIITDVRGDIFSVILTEPDGSTFIGGTELRGDQFRLQDAVMA